MAATAEVVEVPGGQHTLPAAKGLKQLNWTQARTRMADMSMTRPRHAHDTSTTRPQAQVNTFVVDAMVEFARLAAAAGGA